MKKYGNCYLAERRGSHIQCVNAVSLICNLLYMSGGNMMLAK